MDSCHGDGFRVVPVVGNVVAGAGHGDQTEQKKHSSDLHFDLRRRKAAWTVNSRARGNRGCGVGGGGGRDRVEVGDGKERRDGGKCGGKGRDRNDRKRSDGGWGGRGVMASWGASREVGELKREKERKRGSEEKVCVGGGGGGSGIAPFEIKSNKVIFVNLKHIT